MPRHASAVPLLLVGLCAYGPPARAGERAHILDTGAKQLVEVDLAAGRRLASLTLEGNPAWLDADERFVLVFDRGPGEDRDDRGYQATARSSVTIVDAASLKPVGRVELGSGLSRAAFLPDGRLAVLCPGYEAKNPKESQARELVIVDLAAARETGRLTLEPGTSWRALSKDRRTLALLQGLPRQGKLPYPESKLWLVDVSAPRVVATLDAGPWPMVEADGERLYLLHPGAPSKDPQKSRNGAIRVVPFADPRPEQIDAGRSPVASLVEGDLLAVVSEGPAGGAGELRLLRQGKLAATLAVASRPARLASANGALFVVGASAVTIVDPAAAQLTATIPLAKGGAAIVDDGDDPTEWATSADGRRAFIHYGPQHKLAVMDLEQKKVIGVAKTGSGGKKFLNYMKDAMVLNTTGLYRIPGYRFDHPAHLQVRPDGRYAYAINQETKDVTVVDADTAQAVEKIGGAGNRLLLLGGPTVVVLGSEIHLIDAARNVKAGEIRLPHLRGLVLSPTAAVVLAERTVLILDAATGRERARLTDFVEPTDVALRAGATPPEP
jgi:DNA-binding beta-propeller fold protein YncE